MALVVTNLVGFGGKSYVAPFAGAIPGSTQSSSEQVFDGGNADAGWRFRSDGTVDDWEGASYSPDHSWSDPSGSGREPGDYFEIRAVKSAGTTPDGDSLSTWLPLTTARTWTLSQSGDGAKSCTLTITIRDVNTNDTLDTGTYELSATVTTI